MAHTHARFGPQLRAHRLAHALSQETLASRAQVSTRHLSCLENGKAAPSREMVLVLGSALDLPLRARNALLGAAGFAAVYASSALEGEALEPVRRALDHILAAQEPYGAVVFDRDYDVLRMNRGAARLIAWAAEGCDAPPEVWSNVARATLDPRALRGRIVNGDEVAAELVARMLRELECEHDPARRARIEALITLGGAARAPSPAAGATPAMVLHFRRGDVDLRLFTTLTTLGTPTDITAQELRIESYFPADDATARALQALVG
jgi:transcriptional regulator with XRE-family HTH domain